MGFCAGSASSSFAGGFDRRRGLDVRFVSALHLWSARFGVEFPGLPKEHLRIHRIRCQSTSSLETRVYGIHWYAKRAPRGFKRPAL